MQATFRLLSIQLQTIQTNADSMLDAISDTQIINTRFVHLSGLTNLQGLGLDGAQITDAGVATLKETFPRTLSPANAISRR